MDITKETVPCCDCRSPFARQVLVINGSKYGSGRCDPCITRFTATTESKRQMDADTERESIWAKVCPASYRDTDPRDTRLNATARSVAGRWDAARAMRGVGLIGSTGLGKTRCLFLALHRAHKEGRRVAAISHAKFGRVAMDAFSGQAEERARAKDTLRALHRADVLLLDDLGKPPSTERADSELEELIEDRTAHSRPILWSANGSGDWLISRFGADRGEPTVRRLAEFCEVVSL